MNIIDPLVGLPKVRPTKICLEMRVAGTRTIYQWRGDDGRAYSKEFRTLEGASLWPESIQPENNKTTL